ncbi:MAG: DUF3472 domain-containing protein [Arenibacter latericius]|nr:DUF3472 domain-containing protein [Arenibacter latericius]
MIKTMSFSPIKSSTIFVKSCKQLIPIAFGSLFLLSTSCNSLPKNTKNLEEVTKSLDLPVAIKPGGNSWIVNNLEQNHKVISDAGIRDWKDSDDIIRTYFKTEETGDLNVGLSLKVPAGTSTLKITVGDVSKTIEVANANFETVEAGTFKIEEPGYHFVELQGVNKSGDSFAEINDVLVGGAATEGDITYVKEDFYWGRRGPSVHLNYAVPEKKDILWFYNEITVPEKEDVIGTYYMANGFGEGYFGIQVNSPTERRILFSVWSPYETQDPKSIPEEYKIILLGKGEGVTTGEFGNEGSGGQSYKVFNWKAGNTYRFLLKGEPSENNSTDYTAYFYDAETEEWNLIAGFRRPHTSTYLKRPHSFLENFRTEMGPVSRMAHYGNQWIMDTNGEWHELTKAKFTADATARKGSRDDYAGGVKGNTFFMKNCGFFDEMTTVDTFHERTANGVQPQIDFTSLEKL